MFFRQFKVEGLGCFSYLIGCPKEGVACVVDPERHVEQYLDVAQDEGLRITDVFDTHVHADHITGSQELAAQTGATVHIHPAAEAEYAHEPLREGQRFRFGAAEIEIIETPGHTPNSVSLAVTDHARSKDVQALLTGDLLFVGDIGRPDLAGEDLLEQQVRNLYDSLYKKLARFPDWTEVYPAHGEGSLCGKGMSAKPMTTLGYERRNNPLLNDMPFEEFRRIMTEGFQVRPDNFAAMVEKNRQGPKLLRETASFTRLSASQVERAVHDGAKLVDVRDQVAFGAAFLPGSINIGMKPNSVNWLGMVVDAASEIILVADGEADALEAAFRFRRAGYDRLIGYLADGVSGWAMQGKALDHLPQLTASSLIHVLEKYPDHLVLDVRTDAEWQIGHIDGAIHKPVSDLIASGIDLDKKRHITAVCGSGYRGNIAGSFLKSLGYEHVFSLIGGMTAWNAARRAPST
jgi:glyoxylase-like metal-dependent hydrolase (beta-lactamase superfamily II)/rhodanese-related sulfurtransferase